MKRILFVDDEVSILDGLRRILRPMRKKWEMAFASSGESALAVLDEAAFDVVVSDMRMPGMDGAALLELIREKSPGTLRIILSGYTELQASLRAVPVAHQFLLKPCDADMLSASIARATSLNDVLNSRMLTNLVGSLRDLPSSPRVFAELKAALTEPNVATEKIVHIVEQDVALSAKLLQLVNSAFFGLARDVVDLNTAVGCLGVPILHDLVLTLNLFRPFTLDEFVTEDYLEGFQRHALLTAAIASRIVRDRKQSPAVIQAAFLHDVGKLVIAERTPAHFARARIQSESEDKAFFETEEKLTGISHAEVGAYLLSLWGLPHPIVEAIAHHHHPQRATPEGLDTVVTVYLANLLAHEKEAAEKRTRPPAIDMEILQKCGIADQVPGWRQFANALSTGQLQMVG
jgi:putative nucleotidyltransferase with HDIG domain